MGRRKRGRRVGRGVRGEIHMENDNEREQRRGVERLMIE
jgi:hypothetical protein